MELQAPFVRWVRFAAGAEARKAAHFGAFCAIHVGFVLHFFLPSTLILSHPIRVPEWQVGSFCILLDAAQRCVSLHGASPARHIVDWPRARTSQTSPETLRARHRRASSPSIPPWLRAARTSGATPRRDPSIS
jgi:hypothetical protein